MTRWSFEVPFKHLQDFDDLQDFHFTLIGNYDAPCYREYIRDVCRRRLTQVWLDNGFNETGSPTDVSRLALITKMYPDISMIVAPDAIDWTTQQICDSYQEAKGRFGKYMVMVVVSDWDMYQELSRMGAEHFAVPYRTRLDRFSAKELYKMPSLHFLGLNHPDEVIEAQPASCDTSMPVKLGLKYIHLKDWIGAGCFHIHTEEGFFEASMNPTQIRVARDNIKQLKEMCNG